MTYLEATILLSAGALLLVIAIGFNMLLSRMADDWRQDDLDHERARHDPQEYPVTYVR